MNATNPRPKQMTKLLEKISHNLPDLNITFTGHDQPWVSLSSLSLSLTLVEGTETRLFRHGMADRHCE